MKYKSGERSKLKSEADRANTRTRIMSMPQYSARESFTRLDCQAQLGLESSVATMALRDMVSRNLLTMKIVDEKGTMAFKANPKSQLREKWRKRWFAFESQYVPRYF